MLAMLINRPYVFAFLAAFIFLGRIYWGWKKTFIWLVLGYFIAWASEASSINNGFPYGIYHYIYENMQGEPMVMGVPFWDSLSYPFMIFAGLTTARFILGETGTEIPEQKKTYTFANFRTALFGAWLVMLLDVIIDPVTKLGDRWFLGKIYYYPNGGLYFGVPISNFLGWLLVSFTVIFIFQLIENRWLRYPNLKLSGVLRFFNPLFYISIALFGTVITFSIGEKVLGSIACMIIAPVVAMVIRRVRTPTV